MLDSQILKQQYSAVSVNTFVTRKNRQRTAAGGQTAIGLDHWLMVTVGISRASLDSRSQAHGGRDRDGDIGWHALPFSWQTELLDPSMISGSLGFSESLDRRFGKNYRREDDGRSWSYARSSESSGGSGYPVSRHGHERRESPGKVPALFVWKDISGASIVVMYHHGYGGIVRVPESDLAIAIVVRGDNSGPHTPDEISKIYSGLHQPRAF